ncbi:phosphoenolpyruvate--protein phosphotransferase [Acidiphilium iwatense]|uniref:Phosphoenolpyruvate-protein phosphotransferase n=1 Tax=Acidiphilium iwatense TaxID=768198 RepID=A0ABS9DTJ2_9PROT|nr:phosphoenolpyruvate--protein phosphotransferase [Acidiphilium iwatense]MCF3946014.1 phosphoenolpyruvate--protein phosphotransferase [Acidiphilium iwatense]
MRSGDAPPRKSRRQTRLGGTPIMPGIGIGPITFAEEPALPNPRQKIAASDIQAELRQFDDAAKQARKQLGKLKARLTTLPEEAQTEIAPLIEAHLHMLGSSRLMRAIQSAIEDRLVSAATAVIEVAEDQARTLLALRRGADDGAAAARQAEEVRDIGRRLLRNLTHLPFRSFSGLPQGGILVAEQLRPSDAALIDPAHFAGIATEEGSADSHTAVMLRAIGVPAALGIPGLLAAARPGSTAILDGESGAIILNPGQRGLAEAARLRTSFARAQRGLVRLRRLASETLDHVPIELQANLELPFELPMVAQSGATGIGLMRTEFLFMNRETVPDEDTQYTIYREAIEAMDGDPVTIRLLDWGSDKEAEALVASDAISVAREANPALGLRGIRLLLQNPKLLETQIAAVLRAAAFGPVRILVPMVSRISEIETVRHEVDRVWRRLRTRQTRLPALAPPIGIMVETPAAALNATAFARHVAFFAIGTNDLTMYAMAADRALSDRTGLYDPLNPAVLRLIAMTVAAGENAGVSVSICGELASRPEAVPLLIGLGLRQFSMHGGAVLRVKRAVRATEVTSCIGLAEAALMASGAKVVHALIAQTAIGS